jgi:hypothetical protein
MTADKEVEESITPQQYFDLLVETSKSGGFPSINYPLKTYPTRGTCMYRNPNGKRCAFGLLIRDEKYRPSMEEETATDDFFRRYPGCFTPVQGFKQEGRFKETNDYLAVQLTHDREAFKTQNGNSWDHKSFVGALLNLPCFSSVKYTP